MSDSNDASFDIAPFDFDSLMDSQKAATIDSHKGMQQDLDSFFTKSTKFRQEYLI